MRTQQLTKLKDLCLENDLDDQLIDKSLTYAENMSYLLSLIGKTEDQLVEEYARTYEDMEKHVTVKERYGLDFEKLEPPESQGARFRAVIKYRFRAIQAKQYTQFPEYVAKGKRTEVIKNRIDLCGLCGFQNCMSKTSVTVKKDIIIIRGNSSSIMSVKLRLENTGIINRIVKVKRIDKGLMWLQGVGWIKKPEQPKPLFWGVKNGKKDSPNNRRSGKSRRASSNARASRANS